MDFYKNNREYLEGFLGKPEEFNGIVFMLKEPDHDAVKEGENDKRFFWFKRVVHDEKYYEDDLSEKKKITNKRVARAFKNRFVEMLRALGLGEEELKNSVFCNVHPEFGGVIESEEYKHTKRENSLNKMQVLVEQCIKKQGKRELTIFTCKGTYEVLKKRYIEEGHLRPEEEKKGVIYPKEKTKNKFSVQTEDYMITVFEIIHPSRSPHICEIK